MNQFILTRPLIFFDLESTGNDRNKDRIVQFCFYSQLPDGSTDIFSAKVKPAIPISEEATAVHGISTEEAKQYPSLGSYAHQIYNRIEDADLVGYGCLQFDVPLLFNELCREGIVWDYTRNNIIDCCNIYKRYTPRDLSAAYQYYMDMPMHGAHDAEHDVLATRAVFYGQFVRHDLQADFGAMARFSNHDRQLVDLNGKFITNEKGEIIINFSNNKGLRAKDNLPFLQWMLDKEFSEDVKIICRKVIEDNEVKQDPNWLF